MTFGFTDENWKHIYQEPFLTTKSTTLRWLQVRINHNILVTNTFLCRIQAINCSLCSLCNAEPETIRHLFWQCTKTQKLLNQLREWLTSNNITTELTEKSFLFGLFQSKITEIDKIIFMATKDYIYRSRIFKNNLYLSALKVKLAETYKIHRQIAQNNNTLEFFELSWNKYEVLFLWKQCTLTALDDSNKI